MRLLFAVLALPMAAVACRTNSLPTAVVEVSDQHLTVELATTAEQRSRGLMFRRRLAENRGMLFVFPRDQQLSFYMKNTTIPLSIAYISRDGTIREIHPLRPLDLRPVSSSWPLRYALEVNQGWFARHRVQVGDRISLPPG